MRKTGSQTGNSLVSIQTGTLDLTVHLNASESESVGESGTFSDEGSELAESLIASSFEGDVDDESEVLRSKERRNVLLDQVETSLEPFCRFRE
jgi:hypothetical protein